VISAVLLAAGNSTRMGKLKQLLPFGTSTILEQVIDNLLGSVVKEIVVVVGHRAEGVIKTASSKPVKVVLNSDPEQGMSTSIIAGLNAVDSQAQAFMIALGDQPLIDGWIINRLIEEFHHHDKGIVIPTYQGKRGHPIIFARKYRHELLALRGDVGGREIVRNHLEDILEVAVNCEGIYLDIDTPQSLSVCRSKLKKTLRR